MVDVSAKPPTARRAVAEALVAVSPETMSLVIDGGGPKGDVLGRGRARRASWARKRTSDLIPLCHPLALTDLVVAITPDRAAGVLRIRAEAATTGPTGVEMEAMTAASVAALTVYDMVKGVERGVEIRAVRLLSKTGGKSGDVGRAATTGPTEARPRRGPARGRGDRAAGRVGSKQQASPGERTGAPVGRRPGPDRAATASTAGVRDDASGERAGRAPGRARVRRRADRSCPTIGRPSRPRCGPAPRGHRARRHDGRDRPDAARRDAAGDPCRHRLRGPGSGRGDARRRPAAHAAGRPVARRRRRHRALARRQRARQPEGRHRVARRRSSPVLDHALETLAGPHDHGETVSDRSSTFENVPAYLLVFPVFWGAAAFFCLAMARHLRVFAAARTAGPSPFADIATRLAASSTTPSSRPRCSRTRPPG